MSITEANRLIKKYVKLREMIRKNPSNNVAKKFRKQKQLCLEKFNYLVLTKTSRYKNFNNYDDLNQEGLEAILLGLNSYDPKKGNIFWWLHKYIDTRIARTANLHTTIRFPLKYAKINVPHREQLLPILADASTDDQYNVMEQNESLNLMKKHFDHLNNSQKQIVELVFGMDGNKPKSISKVCQELLISRNTCVKTLKQALSILKRNMQQPSI